MLKGDFVNIKYHLTIFNSDYSDSEDVLHIFNGVIVHAFSAANTFGNIIRETIGIVLCTKCTVASSITDGSYKNFEFLTDGKVVEVTYKKHFIIEKAIK